MSERFDIDRALYGDKNFRPARATERARNNAARKYFSGLGISFAALGAGALKEHLVDTGTVDLNPQLMSPFESAILFHAGDFASAFLFAHTAQMALGMALPTMPYRVRTGLSAGLAASAVTLVELKSLVGAPEPADIPAGIVGIGLFIGASLWARRAIKKGSR